MYMQAFSFNPVLSFNQHVSAGQMSYSQYVQWPPPPFLVAIIGILIVRPLKKRVC